MDQSRKFDLEEVAQAIENARSNAEREYYEKIIYKITGTSDAVFYWRNELIKAIRSEDKRRKTYCIEKIQRIRQDETYGKSWGSDRGNKYAN